MLCQDCKKREAQVRVQKIVNNEKIMLNLCNECAAHRGFHSPLAPEPFPLADMLSGMTKTEGGHEEPLEDINCEACGMSFEQFTRQGRFGCGDCYESFRPRLESILRKIHGASLHRGRSPEFAQFDDSAKVIPVAEETRLQTELRKAIEAEDFERAAELRDKLKAVRDKAPS